jgi:periplasmic protein TonB
MKNISKVLFFGLFVLKSILGFSQTDSINSTPKELITIVESWPEFPGGEEARINYLKSNVQLPKNWNPDSIAGKVYIQFIVEVNGNIANPKILRGLDPVLDSIAIKAIRNMPKWIPAKQKGKPVACIFNLPINFGTDKKKKK